jgi:hypothetical protein
MTDSYNSTTGELHPPAEGEPQGSSDAGKTVLVGVLGGLLSAAGYLVYQRLPEDQKDKLHKQVRAVVETRIAEIRQNFNI